MPFLPQSSKASFETSVRDRVDPLDEEEQQTRSFVLQSVSSVGSRLAAAAVVLCLGGAVLASGMGAGLARQLKRRWPWRRHWVAIPCIRFRVRWR